MLKSTDNLVDQQTRLVTNRINQTEKFFDDLGQGFSEYSRKSARLRDKLDDLSKIILDLLQSQPPMEDCNLLSIEKGLVDVGQTITHLADCRDWETNQIETQIIGELSQYDQVCKALREEVKINASIRNKEVLRKRAAEQKRGSTVLRADRDFEKIIEDFEEQKNKDLKELLLAFVNIQLKVHLDGVNQLTKLYGKLKDIDCSEDAIKYRDEILEGKKIIPLEAKLIKSRSQSMGALNNLMHPSNPFRRRLSSKYQQQAERLNRSQEDIIEATTEKVVIPPKIHLETEEEDESDEEGTVSEESDTDRERLDRKAHQLHVPKYN